MATHGTVGPFEPSSETWTAYAERLEQYFIANDVVSADKKRAVLLSVCGPTTYQLIRNLLAPTKPTTKSFDELVKLVKDHHHPAPSVTVQRYEFNKRIRKEGESFANFVAHLKQLSEHCKFGEALNDMLRDRLICGCNSERLRHQLLAKSPPPTFDEAFALAQAFESAERNAKDIQAPVQTPVHAVRKSQGTRQYASRTTDCYRCGGKHSPSVCRFKDEPCHFCKKKGHIARVCRTKARQQRSTGPNHGNRATARKTHQVDDRNSPATSPSPPLGDSYNLFTVGDRSTRKRAGPLMVTMNVNGKDVSMEVDTGAHFSLISESTYRTLWPRDEPRLLPIDIPLQTYTGEKLSILGSIEVNVKYAFQAQQYLLKLLVVAGSGPSLLGRDWMSHIILDWKSFGLFQVRSTDTRLHDVLARHTNVFKDELGLVKGTTAKIHVDPGSKPRFCNPRPVPYALRSKVEQELERLEKDGIIEPIHFSEWAAPIVPVVKRNGSIRVCGDYKVTVNQAAKLDTYPLPRIEDIFAKLARGKAFSKLDLAHAYQQLALDEDSKEYTTINTHKGLYRYNRLPFGIHSAPAIFQRTMEGILRGISHVTVYIDDILITGENEEEHLKNLDAVLTRLENEGLRLKMEKCAFMLPKIEYLGHTISANGLHPSQDKVRAIVDAPVPHNVSQLRSFLGMVNYYGKFLNQLSSLLAPLYKLLQQKTRWHWGQQQQDAFKRVKHLLTSSQLLVHFDPEKELILSCDASPYGVGAVLSHIMDDGSEQPIAFASRSLAPAEKKYAQLEKEGLSIVFGVKKFHQYLYGRHFLIYSDHRPLEHLFSETKSIPMMASARIQRWALTLSAYDYSIIYKPGKEHANADLLSRLPLPDTITDVPLPGETVLLMETLQTSPVTADQIRRWTDRDPVLAQVKNFVQKGWSFTNEDDLKPYAQRRDELSVQDGCLLWGCRVIIPSTGRDKILDELHNGHPGVSRMKGIARSIAWWPGIDSDLQERVRKCEKCQLHQKSPALAPLHPWEWPKRPWARVHIDHAGPFQGKLFLVVIDAHSKWLDVMVVPSTSSEATIKALRPMFACHGLPEIIVSDNGTAFTSNEFQEFVKRNGIRHITTAPYHPATNGLAERAVQTFKAGLNKSIHGDVETKLARFLFSYRTTPHSTTGVTPAELMMGRKLRNHLDLIQPDLSSRVLARQTNQKIGHDKRVKERHIAVNQPIYARNFSSGPKWLPGRVITSQGSTLEIELNDGRKVRRHLDQVRNRTNEVAESTEVGDLPIDVSAQTDRQQAVSTSLEQPDLRRSIRIRHPPDRYSPVLN